MTPRVVARTGNIFNHVECANIVGDILGAACTENVYLLTEATRQSWPQARNTTLSNITQEYNQKNNMYFTTKEEVHTHQYHRQAPNSTPCNIIRDLPA